MIGHRKCQDFFCYGIREYPLPLCEFLYIFSDFRIFLSTGCRKIFQLFTRGSGLSLGIGSVGRWKIFRNFMGLEKVYAKSRI